MAARRGEIPAAEPGLIHPSEMSSAAPRPRLRVGEQLAENRGAMWAHVGDWRILGVQPG